jgi:hypothetical protein
VQLFEPIVEVAQRHPNFQSILLRRNPYNLDVMQGWAHGFVDRDGKFVREFQTTFNSSFWELYLFAMLKAYGLEVDFSESSPDFYLPNPGFNIEAAIASHAQGAEPEHVMNRGALTTALDEVNRQTIIRLSNALVTKHRKFQTHYAQLAHVKGRPFVLAVNQFDRPFSHTSAQRPIEAVLLGHYVDEDRFFAEGPGNVLEGEALSRVFKENGSPVELGLFETPAFEDISAVIFNSCATFGKVRALSADPEDNSVFFGLRLNTQSPLPHVIQAPKSLYQETLLDGLRVYHNRFAKYPLDPAVFRNPDVFQLYWDCGRPRAEERDGLLLSRSLFTAMTSAT